MNALSPDQGRILEKLLNRKLNSAPPPDISSVPAGAIVPLSPAQARIWFFTRMYPDSAEYNLFVARAFDQFPSREKIAAVTRILMQRHDALRLRIIEIDGEPVQEDCGEIEPHIEWHDLRLLPAEEARQQADSITGDAAVRPFATDEPPMFRVVAIALPAGRGVLGMGFHHLATDQWSWGLLEGEISDLLAGRPLTPASAVSYLDYVAWAGKTIDHDRRQRELGYWKAKLSGDLPLLDLPSDRPRSAARTRQGQVARFSAGRSVVGQLTRFASAEHTTVFVVLLAAYMVFLEHLTFQQDIIVGAPLAGRDHPFAEKIVGCFIKPIALRVSLSGASSFREIVHRVHETVFAAQDNQGVPYEQIVASLSGSRVTGGDPVYRTMFDAQSSTDGHAIGYGSGWVDVHNKTTKVDLITGISLTPDGLEGVMEYSTDLFDHATITRYSDMYVHLLEEAIAAPGEQPRNLSLISSGERHRIATSLNKYEYPSTPYHALSEPFELQAERTPHAVAIITEQESITYAELNSRANQLARFLRTLGAEAGQVVALCLERGLQLMIALYAVAKSGATYLPIDPELPDQRISFMLRDAAPIAILADDANARRLPAGRWEIVSVETGEWRWSRRPSTNLPAEGHLKDLAYLLYTSGSSGRPKPVAYPIDGALANIFWLQRRYPFRLGDTAVLKTSYGFDVSIWEIFWPLYFGARVTIARPGGHRDPDYLRDLFERHSVTTAFFVPTMMQPFLDRASAGSCPALRWVLCGGEPVTARLRDRFHQRLSAELINCCGPTEAGSVVDMVIPRELGNPVVARGRPAPNFRAYVLDEDEEIAPIGVPGELFVGGEVGLARGFHNRPALTAEWFVPDPFGLPGTRMYRTGDLCRYREDGALEHLGRIGRQVKVRGMRVELTEIEAVLSEHTSVRECAVMLDGDDGRIAAFVVPADGAAVSVRELKDHARRLLPAHMVPATITTVASIPTNINCKADYKALRSQLKHIGRDDDHEFVPPEGEREIRLASIFQRVLGLGSVGATDGFFELGGHSLLVFKLIAACAEEFSTAPSVDDIFAAPSVRELTLRLGAPADARANLVLLSERSGGPVVVFVHGASGSLLPLRRIAQQMAADFDVYGLQDTGAVTEGQPYSIERLATDYITAVDAVRGPAPLILVGWSMGGCVALEMAREWRRRGTDVAAAVMLDTWLPPALLRSASIAAGARTAIAAVDVEVEATAVTLVGAGAELERLRKILDRNRDAFLSYKPKWFDEQVFLLRASEPYPDPAVSFPGEYLSGDRGWGEHVRKVSVYDILGNHLSLGDERNAGPLAAIIGDIASRQLSYEEI